MKEVLAGSSTMLAINSRGISEAEAAREAGASAIHMPEASIRQLAGHCQGMIMGASVHSVVCVAVSNALRATPSSILF